MPLFEPATCNRAQPMSDPVVRTYLELTDPARIKPAGEPRVQARIAKVEPPDGHTSRWFYEHIGRDFHWTDHLGRTDDEWQRWADQVETWVATIDDQRAGYYELKADHAGTEIAYFGLLPHARGQGLGGYLLTHALHRGFELAPHVWVHTCTLDGPHALPNYQARGLVPYKRETLPSA
jgi:GNAT superfamily N-acetyltransferase